MWIRPEVGGPTPSEIDPVEAVLGTLTDAYVLTDLDGTVLVANRRARQLLTGTDQAHPPPLADWTPDRELGEDLLHRWRASSSPRPAAFRLASGRSVRGDGARLGRRAWVLIRLRDRQESGVAYKNLATRLRSENLRALSQRLDSAVTELHSVNRQLRNANEELQQYAGAVAHDVRTPLFTIRGFAQMLRERGHVDEQGAELVDLILQSAERLHQTTESLLAVARLEEQGPVTDTISVRAVLGEALADQAPEVEAAEATITTDHLDDLDVAVPAVALRQVFQNLLANSLRFREPERPLTIEVSGHRAGDLAEIRVTDNGVGVSATESDRVFDLFQRGTRQAGTPGHGIGLATCRKLVNRWGGSIRCEPAPGPGTSFVFTAPAEPTATTSGLA